MEKGIEHIPVLLNRKKCEPRKINKRATCQGFEVKHIGRGQYYGIILEDNGRFLTGDFSVLNAHTA